MDIQTFTRKPFHVQAVRVTADNMDEVAKWCGGKVIDRANPKNKSQEQYYVKVNVVRPITEKQTMAFVGNYVLKTGHGFKVYTKVGLDKTFEEVDPLLLEKNTPVEKKIEMPANFKAFLGRSKNLEKQPVQGPIRSDGSCAC